MVQDVYRDPEAILEHIANPGTSMGAIFAIIDCTFEVFGSPSPKLLEAAEGLSLKVFAPFQSM